MNKDKLLNIHTFVFNPHDNGGESLTLTTKFYHNGDKVNGIYTEQEICLQSYCNCASITLSGAQITDENLLDLIRELSAARTKAEKELANE